MGDRIEELKGNVKEGAGKLTGNTEMQAEGAAEKEAARAERHAKGVGNQVKGSIEEGVGKLTDDEAMRAQGTADKIKGDTQRTG